MKTITMKELMKQAHKNAKTYEGDYQACLKLAIIELRREYKVINNNSKKSNSAVKTNSDVPHTVKIDYTKFSSHYIELVTSAIDKTKASENKKAEIKNFIFENSENDSHLVATFIHRFEKSFMKAVSQLTNTNYVFGLDSVYSDAMTNLIEKVQKGYIIEKSIKQAFKFEVMNIVKKETRRHQRNTYTSMNDENYVEVSLHNDIDTNEYYNNIPVEKILRDMDMENMLNEKQNEVLSYMIKGYSKTQIDEIFGQRMDRTYNAIKEIMEAYVKHGYSEYLYI